jgi:trehalose 6-phosphate phosphatase
MITRNLMESLPEIAQRIDRAENILLGLDFDGTLTPIRAHPDEAALPEPVRAVLNRLACLPQVKVMIVTGRSLMDIACRVGLPGLIYAGNHGLEIRGPSLVLVEPTAVALVDRLQELTSRLRERLRDVPDALVEPKGLTTSVHYRNVPPELWDELAHIVCQVVASDPDHFVLTTGHRVWEILPRVSWHKGRAVSWVLDHLNDPAHRLAFFLGDDRTDEDAFASLTDGVTVRVGHAQASTHARYQLADPAAVERFLDWLAEKLSPGQRRFPL